VRQHLTTLTVRGLVQRVEPVKTGGRPQARYALTGEGRELFPRNYGAIAAALVAQLQLKIGDDEVGAMLQELGSTVAATQPALAERLDALGYEAIPARHGDDWQVEAFNCVFHGLARRHPEVCRFDIAYMEGVSRRRVHHMECIVRGGHVCRFRLGKEAPRT